MVTQEEFELVKMGWAKKMMKEYETGDTELTPHYMVQLFYDIIMGQHNDYILKEAHTVAAELKKVNGDTDD